MNANQVIINGVTRLDLTEDTVTPDTVLEGVSFHSADGERREGSVVVAPIDDTTPSTNKVYSSSKVNTLVGAKYSKPSGGIPKTDLASAVQTSLEKADSSIQTNRTYYCTCDTGADISAKVVTCDDTTFKLEKGAIVVVSFTTTNTASNVTLNINNTGAKAIKYQGEAYAGASSSYCGYALRQLVYMYDGDGWCWIGKSWDNNNTYTNVALGQGYVTCATAESTTAKVGTLTNYALTVGGIVSVKFTYGVPANATLNINSKGAKNIYYKNAKITSGVIKAGDLATFIYNGSQYHLISIDRWQDDVDNLTNKIKSIDFISSKSSLEEALVEFASIDNRTHQYLDMSGGIKTITIEYTKGEMIYNHVGYVYANTPKFTYVFVSYDTLYSFNNTKVNFVETLLSDKTSKRIKDINKADESTFLAKAEVGDLCIVQDEEPEVSVVDNALSTTSVNPVQNKVVTEALNKCLYNKDIAMTSSSKLADLPVGVYLMYGQYPTDYPMDLRNSAMAYGNVIVNYASRGGASYKDITLCVIDSTGSKCATRKGLIYNGAITWENLVPIKSKTYTVTTNSGGGAIVDSSISASKIISFTSTTANHIHLSLGNGYFLCVGNDLKVKTNIQTSGVLYYMD